MFFKLFSRMKDASGEVDLVMIMIGIVIVAIVVLMVMTFMLGFSSIEEGTGNPNFRGSSIVTEQHEHTI